MSCMARRSQDMSLEILGYFGSGPGDRAVAFLRVMDSGGDDVKGGEQEGEQWSIQ